MAIVGFCTIFFFHACTRRSHSSSLVGGFIGEVLVTK
jgi:hypothetical protein